jgi:hypothetical protein
VKASEVSKEASIRKAASQHDNQESKLARSTFQLSLRELPLCVHRLRCLKILHHVFSSFSRCFLTIVTQAAFRSTEHASFRRAFSLFLQRCHDLVTILSHKLANHSKKIPSVSKRAGLCGRIARCRKGSRASPRKGAFCVLSVSVFSLRNQVFSGMYLVTV